VTDAALELVGARRAAAMRVVPGQLEPASYLAPADELAADVAPGAAWISRAVLDSVAETGRPVRLDGAELRSHPVLGPVVDAGAEGTATLSLPAYLGVALMSREGQSIGLIQLAAKVDGTPFDDDDEAVVVQLARMASAAIEHIELAASLEQALSRLNMALDASHSGTWEWDMETDRVSWSPGLERIYGFEVGTFPGTLESYQAHVHPDDRAAQAVRVQRALATGQRFEYLHRVIRPDGAVRWVEGAGTPVVDLDGEVVGMTGMTVDITDRKAAEEESARRRRVVETLHRVGQAITSRLQLGEVVQLVTDEATELTPAAFGAFFYNHVDASGESLLLYAISGAERESFAGLPNPRTTAVFAPTFNGEGTVLADDITADPSYGGSGPHHGMPPGHVPVRSYLAVPVVLASGEVAGGLFFGHPEPGRFSAADAELVEGIASYAAIAIDNARLYEETNRIATVLQKSLLPPTLPDIDGFDVSACYDAGSTSVGGDFYDIFPLPEDQWGFVIGDMCGQGPEAASRTALARHTTHTAAVLQREPAAVLEVLNQSMLERDEPDRFCSAVYGTFRYLDDGVLVDLAVAGHPQPIIRRGDGTIERLATSGPVLGVIDEPSFGSASIRLREGDTLVLYTDGVIEARSPDGELFGDDRLDELVRSSEPPVLAALIEQAVLGFRDSDRADDLAVVVLTAGQRQAARRAWLPGLDLARPSDQRSSTSTRLGDNDWVVGVGEASAEAVAAVQTQWGAGVDLDELLVRVAGEAPGACTLVRLQHDSCGVWCTLVGSRARRPIVLRRAGWVDVRGHDDGAVEPDRVGLGPGDTVIVWTTRSGPHDDAAAIDLLDRAGAEASEVVRALDAPALVLRMPVFDDTEGAARAAAVTGLPVEAFAAPIFTPGSADAEVWARRPRPPRVAHLRVEPSVRAVGGVRSLLRRLLNSWRLPELLSSDIELLTSELITNSVVHAATTTDVTIRFDGVTVRVAARDRSHATPAVSSPAPEAEGGRGVWLVESLASAWGVEPLPDGKRVWFDIDTRSRAT
jgi:PAS domain S-box-containing protein